MPRCRSPTYENNNRPYENNQSPDLNYRVGAYSTDLNNINTLIMKIFCLFLFVAATILLSSGMIGIIVLKGLKADKKQEPLSYSEMMSFKESSVYQITVGDSCYILKGKVDTIFSLSSVK